MDYPEKPLDEEITRPIDKATEIMKEINEILDGLGAREEQKKQERRDKAEEMTKHLLQDIDLAFKYLRKVSDGIDVLIEENKKLEEDCKVKNYFLNKTYAEDCMRARELAEARKELDEREKQNKFLKGVIKGLLEDGLISEEELSECKKKYNKG